MRTLTRLAAALAAGLTLTLAACGAAASTPSVPSLAGHSAPASSQAGALHLAGQCIRQHGIPGFPDPTLNSAGQVIFNKTQLATAPQAVVNLALEACRGALAQAGIQAGHRHGPGGAPTSAQLRQLLAFARCMRAHGLPAFADPDPATGELLLPPGFTKNSPVVERATQACRSQLPGGS